MLEAIINQPSRFSVLSVIAAFKEPKVYADGVKTIDVHFITGRGDVLVEYKNSIEHKDRATIQLRCYADYMRITPYRKIIVWGEGRVVDVE